MKRCIGCQEEYSPENMYDEYYCYDCQEEYEDNCEGCEDDCDKECIYYRRG